MNIRYPIYEGVYRILTKILRLLNPFSTPMYLYVCAVAMRGKRNRKHTMFMMNLIINTI